MRALPLAAGAGILAGTIVATVAVRGLANTEASPIAPGGWREAAWTAGLLCALALYLGALVFLRGRPAPLL